MTQELREEYREELKAFKEKTKAFYIRLHGKDGSNLLW